MSLPSAPPNRKPDWLTVRALSTADWGRMNALLQNCDLATVCQEARCPNMGECFHAGTATFLIMGRVCTRSCRFCAIQHGRPDPLDPAEPERLAMAVRQLRLSHVVVTSVTRDDLSDGGANHIANCVRALHQCDTVTVEVLVPDFRGDASALETVVASHPDVQGHNVEVVPRLSQHMRGGADYDRSLELIQRAKTLGTNTYIKSGLMVGVGETHDEVYAVLQDLARIRCDVVTIGQYLQPSPTHYPLAEYIHPDVFEHYGSVARLLGIRVVASGPLVRSSHDAHGLYLAAVKAAAENQGSQTP